VTSVERTRTASGLGERLAALELENGQLRTALESRIVIEQAKGVLAERYATAVDVAFEILRRAARSSQRRIHDLAAEVVASDTTPAAVRTELERLGR
jgi:AmiR/NasT family two-component response regulator